MLCGYMSRRRNGSAPSAALNMAGRTSHRDTSRRPTLASIIFASSAGRHLRDESKRSSSDVRVVQARTDDTDAESGPQKAKDRTGRQKLRNYKSRSTCSTASSSSSSSSSSSPSRSPSPTKLVCSPGRTSSPSPSPSKKAPPSEVETHTAVRNLKDLMDTMATPESSPAKSVPSTPGKFMSPRALSNPCAPPSPMTPPLFIVRPAVSTPPARQTPTATTPVISSPPAISSIHVPSTSPPPTTAPGILIPPPPEFCSEKSPLEHTSPFSIPSFGLDISPPSLAQLEVQKSERILVSLAGTVFITSKKTLSQDPDSILYQMLQEDSNFKVSDTGKYFFDRDPRHFRHILNYLRNGARVDAETLPKDQQSLLELLHEARYFNLKGLEATIIRRLHFIQELVRFGH